MRRVSILGYVQNPPRCDKIEDLGRSLEKSLAKMRQYEEFTDRDGNPCQVQVASLMAVMFRLMPKVLEKTVIFQAEAHSDFGSFFDKLVSDASTKHSLLLNDELVHCRHEAGPVRHGRRCLGQKEPTEVWAQEQGLSLQHGLRQRPGNVGQSCWTERG